MNDWPKTFFYKLFFYYNAHNAANTDSSCPIVPSEYEQPQIHHPQPFLQSENYALYQEIDTNKQSVSYCYTFRGVGSILEVGG